MHNLLVQCELIPAEIARNRTEKSPVYTGLNPANGTASLLDNVSQLASAAAIFLTVFTDEIYQTPLPLSFHLNILIAAEM